MKVHRFYVGDKLELDKKLWINDQELVHQWSRVLRMRVGEQIILFDGITEDRLYKIDKIEPKAVHLSMITELQRQLPKKDLYLFFALIKKDNVDIILQKCTELGVRHFVPILTERTEKQNFNVDRAQKIVIEASEQCGSSDIPTVRNPIKLKTAVEEFGGKINLFYAQQSSDESSILIDDQAGVFVGPEGGWTDSELEMLNNNVKPLNLSDHVLRAETACIVAVSRLLQ